MKRTSLLSKSFESRHADFLAHFGREVERTVIISFADCNFSCPYCKRGLQFYDGKGQVIGKKQIAMAEIFEKIDDAFRKSEERDEKIRIRLSGGDPSSFPAESLAIAQYVRDNYGEKISLAHNGSDFEYIKMMIDYLDYIAMDYKAFDYERLKIISGIENPVMSQEAILELCRDAGVLVDVRMPIFGDTSEEEVLAVANVASRFENAFFTLRKYQKVKDCEFPAVYADSEIEELARTAKKQYSNLGIGIRAKWKGGFVFM